MKSGVCNEPEASRRTRDQDGVGVGPRLDRHKRSKTARATR